MNGAEALLKTLIDSGVEVCFANPGTSEMQFVAAIDTIPGMRPILGLFEGVVTGAADGYGRMAGKPAATLLHLGSGFSNGMANLHNAKRAFTPMVNIIGEHATHHIPLDAPLSSDIVGHASLNSDWVEVSESADDLPQKGADAVTAALSGQLANLIAPADHAWTESKGAVSPNPIRNKPTISEELVSSAAEALRNGESTCLFLGGETLMEEGLELAHRIQVATGARVIHEVFPARIQRGKGRACMEKLPYLAEMATDVLKDVKQMVVLGSKEPVSFFAYPGKASKLVEESCSVQTLGGPRDDCLDALRRLAQALEAIEVDLPQDPPIPALPQSGDDTSLTAEIVAAVIANNLPEGAIVSDESNTSGAFSYGYFDGAAPHDWLALTGGAIGQGMPVAVGAAVACPDQKVINLQADGSAMYSNQSLWTMARENLDIVTIIYNNKSYAILNFELMRVGVESPGEGAKSMLELTNPTLDWVQIAQGQGVPATRATTFGEFQKQFLEALNSSGPALIEVIL